MAFFFTNIDQIIICINKIYTKIFTNTTILQNSIVTH